MNLNWSRWKPLRRPARYKSAEVQALVEGYAELRELKSTANARGLRILLTLADLDRAILNLPPKEYQAVLLHGQLGHTLRNAELLLGVGRMKLLRRYESGISFIVRYLNGEL